MPFSNPKQRAAFFAKKKASNPFKAPSSAFGNPVTMQPSNTPPKAPEMEEIKIPGLPKSNKFGRVKKFFKM